MLQKVSHVADTTLTSLFIAGLKQPLKQELLIHWSSKQETFSITQQLAACHAISIPYNSHQRSGGQNRERQLQSTPTASPVPNSGNTSQATSQPRFNRDSASMHGLPIVRVSAAERAEKNRKGLCWYCDEVWSRSHVCSKNFLTLMGADDEDDFDSERKTQSEDKGETMLITGDVSTVHIIEPKTKPRALHIKGTINELVVAVIDRGSTHNFIKPSVAAKLSLPFHSIILFRVFVGNGASLKYSYVCLRTPLSLQGHGFEVDLFVLQIEGPDVILEYNGYKN